jgi:MYXO-CTERM domain-containing protein
LPGTDAGGFYPDSGGRNADSEDRLFHAVAVRPGDVPEPQTLALALLGLGAAVVARRRRAAKALPSNV